MTSATGPDVFVRATRRLVLLFTAIVVLLIVVSGVIMYLDFTTNIRDVAQGGSGGGETEVERELASRSISRFRWQLIAVDGVIIVAVGALGLWYASRTLQPIRETYAAQKRFLTDASHELRTPLAIMKADFEVALRDSGGGPPGEAGPPGTRVGTHEAPAQQPDELREALESGLEEVDRMSSIVDDVLLLSRIDAHQEELRFAQVDLSELVRRTVESMRAMAEGGAVALAVTAPSGAVTASADAPHLERALRNVLKNAIEHSAAGDTVQVTLDVASGSAEIRVADQGPGIPAADLDHVFDRFYRTDASRSRDAGGSGLGLAIARWIVEQHKGSIAAAGEPGEGTTVAIDVPLAAR